MLKWLAVGLSLFWILFLYVEQILLQFARKKIQTVIHVNGTRGKSTIVRLIDAGLRSNRNLRVYSKITGTTPSVINVNGDAVPIKRWGKANINEQVRQVIQASRQKAQVLIIECMAIQPELQKVCEERILHADILVLSNVRHDHIPEMGNNLEQVAMSYTSTFPQEGTIFTAEPNYQEIFEKVSETKNSTLIHIADNTLDAQLPGIEKWPVFLRENIALALAVCEKLGLKKEEAWQGMQDYLPDPYSFKIYKLPSGAIFANALSANDPDSTEKIMQWLISRTEMQARKLIILLNCREDRPARSFELLKWISKQTFEEVWILGYIHIPKKYDSKNIIKYQKLKDLPFDYLHGHELIFAVGNVAGVGYQLIEDIAERAERNV